MKARVGVRRAIRVALPLAVTLTTASCGEGGVAGSSTPIATTPTPTPAPSPTPTPTPIASALTQADVQIGECINLSNMLEAPNEGDYGRAFVDADFGDIAGKGFQTIRIPARFSNHALNGPPYTIDTSFMARIDKAVTLARAAGLRVIIDNHNYDALMANPSAESARFTALWQQIADHFKNADGKVWFELMNEPNTNLTNSNLLSIYNPAIAAIRATNATRPIIVGGESYSSIGSLATLPIPNDANIIVTFHYYDPFDFTHQGATFLTNPPPTGRLYGTAADQAALAVDVQRARDFMVRTGRPVFMGEYGAYEQIPVGQRASYYKAVHDVYAAANIRGCVWGYVNTFNFRDNAVGGSWNAQLLTSIGL